MSKKSSIIDLPSDVLKLITDKLINDPDKMFHKIFYMKQNNKRDREVLNFLFTGACIPNIQYYHPWKANIIQWESKIIEKYLNNLLRKRKEKVNKLCISFYINDLLDPLIKIYIYNNQNEIIVYFTETSDFSRWYLFFSNSKPLEVKKDKLKDELIKIKEHIQSLIFSFSMMSK